MEEQIIFLADEKLKHRFKKAVVERKTTIKAVLTQAVVDYVAETEEKIRKKPRRIIKDK